MMRKQFRVKFMQAAVSGLLIAGLTACSGGESANKGESKNAGTPKPTVQVDPLGGASVTEVRSKALTHMGELDSLVLTGVAAQGVKFTINVHSARYCSGTYTAKQTGTVKFKLSPERFLLKGDKKFWLYASGGDKAQATYADDTAGTKWVTAPEGSWPTLRAYCELKPLFESFTTVGAGEATVTEGTEGTVEVKDELSGITATLVSTPPYELKKYETPTVVLTFSAPNSVSPWREPKEADVLARKLLLPAK